MTISQADGHQPPRALPVPCEATAAVTGAIIEKLEPR